MAPQTAIRKAVCYKTKNEQLWEKAVHFLLVATNWFYASLPTVFCTITANMPAIRSTPAEVVQSKCYRRYIQCDMVTEGFFGFCLQRLKQLLKGSLPQMS